MAVTDKGAVVNPQRRVMGSVAAFAAVEGFIGELTDELMDYPKGLARKKLGESSHTRHVLTLQQGYACTSRECPGLRLMQACRGRWLA
jgi:hypothetical protein